MKLTVKHQESYSRSELLLRTFFGIFYIGFPHIIFQLFYALWAMILGIYSWFHILFTARMPRSYFDIYTKLLRWQLRVGASLMNLVDGYPPFGIDANWDKTDFQIAFNETVTRKRLLFITFASGIILIPSLIFYYLVALGAFLGGLVAFFSILFTGKYPEQIHNYMVGYLRWVVRLDLYMTFMYFDYPGFSLQETENDKKHGE